MYRNGETITVNITWGSVPAEQQTQNAQSGSQSGGSQYGNGQYGSDYPDSYNDLFRYFFGNRFGGYAG